jgi:Lon protease-like protein
MIDGPPLPVVLEDLPLFPLPGVQLFPCTLLPLHIFEPRYRAMTRDALGGARLIGVAMLEPGHDEDERGPPEVRRLCGVGRIVQSHLHPDGRYDILLRGIGRVRILDERANAGPYRRVRARRLDDPAPTAAVAAEQQALIALCDRLAGALPSGGETLRELVRQERGAGAACDVVASALLTEVGERQEVLETLDVAERIQRVCDAVVALLARFGGLHGSGAGPN